MAAQAILVWGIFLHAMPWLGLDMLNLARAVAALDLPARLWRVFGL